MDLAPCEGCRRHVRVDARRCPFCDAAIDPVATRVALIGRVSRAAVFSASLAGCWSSSQQQQTNDNTTTNIVVAAPADAQFAQPPPDATAVVAQAGVVEGTVTDVNSGQGLQGVWVTVQEAQQRKVVTRVMTQGGGRYRVADLPAGQYQLVVQPPGDGHPRHGQPPPVVRAFTIVAGAPPLHADVNVAVPPPYVDHGPCCKPYGAPPVRRRVV